MATELIAWGKAEGRDPRSGSLKLTDPAGVGQVLRPLQGRNRYRNKPGVTLASLVHPRLLTDVPFRDAWHDQGQVVDISELEYRFLTITTIKTNPTPTNSHTSSGSLPTAMSFTPTGSGNG